MLNSHDESNSLSKSWDENAQYLSSLFPLHHFVVIPLDFKALEERVKNHTIEFVITNPLQGLQLEHRYGLGRIATLSSPYKGNYYSELGTVIFTRADAKQIQSYEDARSKKIGAVSEHSFGGYLLGIKELGIASNKNITFFQTHFNVIKAVLNGSVDVGIVRTDIIEQMVHEGFIKQSDLKVLGAKTHPNFPFISSTDLYPGWMLAKMPNTPETLSNELLSTLLKPPSASSSSKPLYRVNTTLDYSKIHHILKELHLFFYEQEVNERTHELSLLNAKLKDLANIDELTKIANRRYFFLLATQYFHAAKRNNTPLHILSIDIDWFKKVNDTYGHAMGDEVLKAFCKHVQSSLRQSDLFGRIGGEEFCVCIQNTPLKGAKILAEKIRHKVEVSRESINN